MSRMAPSWSGEAKSACEECGRYYRTTEQWSNERVCESCMNEIRRQIGEPPMDMDLSPEEREYLRETLGLQEYEDQQLKKDAPFCRSCIEHGPDRKRYPCLRSEEDCAWEHEEMKRKARELLERQQAQQYYYPTSTSTATNYWWINTGSSSTGNFNTINWRNR